MKNKEYWEERAILKDKLLEKDINKIEKKLLKLFKDTRKEVLNELKIIYADIEATEYEKYRIDSLVTNINMALDNLYQRNEEHITEGLKDIYKRFDKEASIDLGVSFNTINENLIREIIKTKWSGLSFSERIWEHRRRLAFTIKSELSAGLTRGDSLQDISKKISDKFNTSYSNAIRLVRTESCWVMNEATVNNYKENGIKEYEFMAFLDKKTSPQCRELDGKIISINEYKAGLNFPPLHPHCRSCIVPVIHELVKPIEEMKDNNIVDNIPADKKGIVDFMQDKLGIKVGNVDNVDKKLLRGCAEFTNEFLSKYPKIKEHSIYKNKFNITEFDGNVYADYKMSQIRLSIKSFKDYDNLISSVKRQHKTGWMITCDEGLEYKQLYIHEFGHFINDLIAMDDDKFFTEEKMANEFKKQLISEYKKTTKEKIKASDIGKLVSEYALTNNCELFAEAFAEYYTNSRPRTFAKLFGDRLEKYLEKYK